MVQKQSQLKKKRIHPWPPETEYWRPLFPNAESVGKTTSSYSKNCLALSVAENEEEFVPIKNISSLSLSISPSLLLASMIPKLSNNQVMKFQYSSIGKGVIKICSIRLLLLHYPPHLTYCPSQSPYHPSPPPPPSSPPPGPPSASPRNTNPPVTTTIFPQFSLASASLPDTFP